MKSVAFATLGCKTNQYETDALIDLFHKSNHLVVDFEEHADIYIINTCTVTQMSDKKSRQLMRRAKKINPDALIVVLGCYAQIATEEVASIDVVDIVIGTNDRANVIEHIHRFETESLPKPYIVVEDIGKVTQFEELKLTEVHEHTRAFIKIQEGCNQFCSYCIIPYARGRVRSRTLDAIVKEVTDLASKGYMEFVLTGIHIGSYGIDFSEDITLIDLIEALHAINGVERIRLGSLEPTLIDDTFTERLSKLSKVCDHFHLSLQSGSNDVLKRMNRKYTREDFVNSVNRLKKIYDHPAITTDIIVGFPGETEAQFNESFSIVDEIAFDEIHVFQFSPRKGTPAAKMSNQVDSHIKKSRSERLIAKGKEKHTDYINHFIGKIMPVIFEDCKNGFWIGHTTNYLVVHVPAGNLTNLTGKVVNVEMIKNSDSFLLGEIYA